MTLARCLLAMLALWSAGPAQAHESLPLVLSVSEASEGIFLLRVRQPPATSSQPAPVVHMPGNCSRLDKKTEFFRCDGGLGGKTLSWSFSGATPAIPTLVRIERLSGEVRTRLAPPGETGITIPPAESPGSVSRQYLAMGIAHILTGYDHLLFLACLLWIAGSLRRILVTVTGFTLAHSLTLALSALNVIHVPIPPVEAAIALSILFLAREIAVGDRSSLVWRHPAVVSSLFGLLHGLGFASALREVGLPQTQVLAGLLFFNLGVEVGQLMAVLAVVGIWALGKRLLNQDRLFVATATLSRLKVGTERIALLSIGTFSAFWFVERLSGLY